MERTNEHYLPRFLMQGFASQIKPGKVKRWWFRRGLQPKEVNITNIAAEKDFHRNITGFTADDCFRRFGNRFAWYIDGLRQETNERRLDDAIIPELIASLTVRTKAFRDEMTGAVTIAAAGSHYRTS